MFIIMSSSCSCFRERNSHRPRVSFSFELRSSGWVKSCEKFVAEDSPSCLSITRMCNKSTSYNKNHIYGLLSKSSRKSQLRLDITAFSYIMHLFSLSDFPFNKCTCSSSRLVHKSISYTFFFLKVTFSI